MRAERRHHTLGHDLHSVSEWAWECELAQRRADRRRIEEVNRGYRRSVRLGVRLCALAPVVTAAILLIPR